MALKRLLSRSPRLTAEMRELIASPDHESLRALARDPPGEYSRGEIQRFMNDFFKPVLVLWGSLDEMNPASHAQDLVLGYPDIEFFQHDQAGHWPWIEDPDWVVSKVVPFLFRLRTAEVQRGA